MGSPTVLINNMMACRLGDIVVEKPRGCYGTGESHRPNRAHPESGLAIATRFSEQGEQMKGSLFLVVTALLVIMCVSSFGQGPASSASGTIVTPPSSLVRGSGNVRTPLFVFLPDEGRQPNSPPSSAETPSSIACIYGVTTPTMGCPRNGSLVASGGSKAIAVVEYGNNSTAQSDFNAFSTQYGLPAQTLQFFCSCNSCPSSDGTGWDLEEALDVQYAHAMAPNAQIIVAEFCSDPIGDGTETDAGEAVAAVGGGEVSNSWTYDGGEFPEELGLDQYFTTPSVVYFASSGDSGWGPTYPSVSPNVVSAGGTHIVRDSNGNFNGEETCWSGSGGGISQYEPLPQYQFILGNILRTHRGTPDLSADADPNTGVAVYNTTYCGGWCEAGGTSVASPVLAGIVNNTGTFARSTSSELNTAYGWYRNPGLYHKYLYDITQGSNGGNGGGAKFGWDQCTGLGSPRDLPVSTSSWTQANEFISGATGSVSQIDIGIGIVSGTNSFYAALYSVSGGEPATLIEQWSDLSSSTTFGQCCGLVSITGITGVSLTAGTSYFLVLGPTNLSSSTLDMWNLNSTGATETVLYANNGCENGTGNNCSWNSRGTQTLGAFDVIGSTGPSGEGKLPPQATFFSDLGTGTNVYQCCAGWQVAGSGGDGAKRLANAPMK